MLETEKAFRGQLIVPSVSRGIVTLTGTVSSEGDKVLASTEVGRVDGVKTVLNNLDVRNAGTPTAAKIASAHQSRRSPGPGSHEGEKRATITATQAISTSAITVPVWLFIADPPDGSRCRQRRPNPEINSMGRWR